ncbi:hypothetical protein A4X13_0g4038 [Tilletia indica]|uniref:Uncharacterized protein n=1 Tax=Tilletia indica TaxID=43049 RepID=A0A8T8SYJ7_9BASI|nr:hypothetical protein A4X13_0g4038 [Tilletia indica]
MDLRIRRGARNASIFRSYMENYNSKIPISRQRFFGYSSASSTLFRRSLLGSGGESGRESVLLLAGVALAAMKLSSEIVILSESAMLKMVKMVLIFLISKYARSILPWPDTQC